MSIRLSKIEQQRIDAENQETEYVNAISKNLPDVIKYAKGKDRTVAQFADECGIPRATLWRIVKGAVLTPVDKKYIKSIAEHSADPYLTYESLMRANGMVPANDNTPKRQLSMERSEKRRADREKTESIITAELIKRGFMVGAVLGTPFEETDPFRKRSSFDFTRFFSFGLRLQGFEPAYWHFRIHSFNEDDYDGSEDHEKAAEEEARYFFVRYSDLFLRDLWEPEAFESCKYSIVLTDRVLFEKITALTERITVIHDFSFILVDIVNGEVVREKMLKRQDGSPRSRFFDIKKHSTVNEDGSENAIQ